MFTRKSFTGLILSAILVVWILPLSVMAQQDNLGARLLAKDMITIVLPLIQNKDLAIQNNIQDDAKLALEQKERFGELLTNILMNAANASPNKGQIKIVYNESKKLLEVIVTDAGTRFDTQHSIKDLRGNTISVESKSGQGVWYRTTI